MLLLSLFSCIFKYIWSRLHLRLNYVSYVCIHICSYYPLCFITRIWSWSLEINSTLFRMDHFYLFWILKQSFKFTWLWNSVFSRYIMRVAPKLMPPLLLCWRTMSEADVGDVAVGVEPSHQYSVKFCCHATDNSRRAVWQNGIWHGKAYEAKVCNWIPSCGKNCIQWCSSTLAERLWRTNWMLAQWSGGWCVSAVATAMWKTSHVPDSHAQLSHHKMKSVSISSSARMGGLLIGNCVRS